MDRPVPMPHQYEGANFIAKRRRSLLLDKPGLGKSRTWIMALDARQKKYKNGMRGVIVCPAIARSNWKREFDKWTNIDRRLVIADDIHDLIAWEKGRFDVNIMSYEFHTKWADRFNERMDFFDFWQADEAHRLKSAESKRALAAFGKDGVSGVSGWAEWGCLLSGTIMPNDPGDIYNPLRWTGIIRSPREEFAKRYFISTEGISNSNKIKFEMRDELRSMIDKVSIRRTLEDANIHLPPILFSNIVLDGNRTELLKFLAEQPDLSKEIYEAIENGNLALLQSPQVATVRRLIAEAKAIPYAELLVSELEGGKDKVAVFGYSRIALGLIVDRLQRSGISVVTLMGGSTRAEDDRALQAFEKDNTARVLVANYAKASEAITIVSCCYMDLFERPWNPGGNEQVVNRIYRIGQQRTTFSRTVTLSGSYDENVNRINEKKNDAMDALGHRMVCETGMVEAIF